MLPKLNLAWVSLFVPVYHGYVPSVPPVPPVPKPGFTDGLLSFDVVLGLRSVLLFKSCLIFRLSSSPCCTLAAQTATSHFAFARVALGFGIAAAFLCWHQVQCLVFRCPYDLLFASQLPG